MKRGVVFAAILLFLLPLAHAISIKELISRYSFSKSSAQINITRYDDYMIDKNEDGINDTMIIELETDNQDGNYIFVVNLADKGGILINETNKTLNAGTNKLNITFDAIFLTQSQFNYSIRVYNSTYSLKYRKDNIITQNYPNYEKGFRIASIADYKEDKTLKIIIALNSTLNGTFETVLFLSYNNSFIFAKSSHIIANQLQNLSFYFNNETIKQTHHIGNFNVSSFRIGKKSIKTDFTTLPYNFKDFAALSYIYKFVDNGVDFDSDGKFDALRIKTSAEILKDGIYTIKLGLYDIFGNMVETKNASVFLTGGNNLVLVDFNGSKIYDKKLNGPFIVKYAQLFESSTLIDHIKSPHATAVYNFNDFDSPNLPDLTANISVSDNHLYGQPNITVNATFKNAGNKHAFNIFIDIIGNNSFYMSNSSNLLHSGSEIIYQITFVNISDFEISAIADLQNFVEESNESNNAYRAIIKLNKRPVLSAVHNISINETDEIMLNLSASDQNSDSLTYSINLSKFSKELNIFRWRTTTTDSGNYTLAASVSDGYLNDISIFKIVVLDVPEKDSDNDGINDSIDRVIGDERSVNTTNINVTVSLNNSKNLTKILNQTVNVKFMDNNLTIAEFDFDFSNNKLNMSNITINKQTANSTGSLLVRGIRLSEGATKALYVDKVNPAFNGVCIKDVEISSINEISGSCSLDNEYAVECDGTLQTSYACAYNSTVNKFKIEGLRNSGIVQISYLKPASAQSASSQQPASPSSSSSGGGGGVACISSWQCREWSKCARGLRLRACSDSNQCAFPSKKPVEQEQCTDAPKEKETLIGSIVKAIVPIGFGKISNDEVKPMYSDNLGSITGQVAGFSGEANQTGVRILLALLTVLVIVGAYITTKYKLLPKILK